jgi:hypothetical protein
MESVYHIVAIRVNETSWAHVWRLRSLYLRTGYDKLRDEDEVESFGFEAPVLAGRLRPLLEHLGITTAPRYRIKEVPRSGRVEFKAIVEIFFGSKVLCRHKGPAFRTSHNDVVADAAWQAITLWVHSNKCRF